MLWCNLDDKDRRSARPCQRSGNSEEQGHILACDEDTVTANARVERRLDRALRLPSRHLETAAAAGLFRPRYQQSSTPSIITENNRRMGALSSEGIIMPPGINTQGHRPGVTDRDDVDCPSSMSTFSSDCPMESHHGRLTNIEILKRVFPLQPRHVLDLVLSGCNGDLVKAIEHFLSVRGASLSAQHGHHSSSHRQRQQNLPRQTLNLAADGHGRPAMRYGCDEGGDGLSVGAAADENELKGSSTLNRMHAALGKSTFPTMLPLPGLGPQSAFCPPAAAFTTNTLLAPAPPSHAHATAVLPATSRVSSPSSLLGFEGWIQSFVGAPHPMFPFLFRHQPHQLRVPPAASRVDHYTREMTAAGTAAAAAGQVTPSLAMVAASDITPGVRSAMPNSDARKREATTSDCDDTAVESQALDLQCRKDVSASR